MSRKNLIIHLYVLLISSLIIMNVTYSYIDDTIENINVMNSHYNSSPVPKNVIRNDIIVIPIKDLPELIGLRIHDIIGVTTCSGDSILYGRVWIMPDKILPSKLYDTYVEVPVLEHKHMTKSDILIIQIYYPSNMNTHHRCPWSKYYAKISVNYRVELNLTITSLSTNVDRKITLYIYYDDHTFIPPTHRITTPPIPILKYLSNKLGIDYHDIYSFRQKLLRFYNTRVKIQGHRIEKMKLFVFTPDYSKILNDPVVGVSTKTALEICPGCPVMNGGGSSGPPEYIGIAYFYYYLTRTENGGIVSSINNPTNYSIVYIGRGKEIYSLSLNIYAYSTGESDSYLTVSLTLQTNTTPDLVNTDSWKNISTYALTFAIPKTLSIITINPLNYFTLNLYQHYKLIIEFTWSYGEKPYILSATLILARRYSSRILKAPISSTAQFPKLQERIYGVEITPSTQQPLTMTTLLSPFSGSLNNDIYGLLLELTIEPEWEISPRQTLILNVKIYINDEQKMYKTIEIEPYGKYNDLYTLALDTGNFIDGEQVRVTVKLEWDHPTYAYVTYRALLITYQYPEIWDPSNPRPYLINTPPALQSQTMGIVKTPDYSHTWYSVMVSQPLAINWIYPYYNVPVKIYFAINDTENIGSWSIFIHANDTIVEASIGSSLKPQETPFIGYLYQGIVIGIGIALTYILQGATLIIQVLSGVVSNTIFGLLNEFIEWLIGEPMLTLHTVDDTTIKVEYKATADSPRSISGIIVLGFEPGNKTISLSIYKDSESKDSYFQSVGYVVRVVYTPNTIINIGYNEPPSWINNTSVRYG